MQSRTIRTTVTEHFERVDGKWEPTHRTESTETTTHGDDA